MRRDLRLHDNPALSAIAQESKNFAVIFIFEPYMYLAKPQYNFGYPQRQFLIRAIPRFAKKFQYFHLIFDYPVKTFSRLAEKYDLTVYVNEDIHPDFYKQLNKLKRAGIKIKLFEDQLTVPKSLLTKDSQIYTVFTPFKKAAWRYLIEAKTASVASFSTMPIPELVSQSIPAVENEIANRVSNRRVFLFEGTELDLDEILGFAPNFDDWYFSEEEAIQIAVSFIEKKLANYHTNRNMLALDATSKLSLALAWGLISARTLKNLILDKLGLRYVEPDDKNNLGPVTFLSELIWREFYKYLLYHFPWLLNLEFQEKKRSILWVKGDVARRRFIAWIKAETGYDLVDAAMMQIAKTGYMHNRARMLVASILTKNLGVDWRAGQEYFRASLIDLDEASNNGGWQWSASVGADPKPIRIFNPYLQADKFDPTGLYRKKWLSETAHSWRNNESHVRDIEPIISHLDARQEALKRYGLFDD
ncbi:MAG: DNA photolyase family protein [Deltaproteobacteria bacterium]|nr:DNA photolyase family protein [Deltaproteobacteria bacterium]